MLLMQRCGNLWCFLTIFCTCYLLETITFTYLITAVTSIERQLHIPSRQSGVLVSASDVGYVLTVVFLAHLGNKGNRARWIGGGCLLISLACFLGALPGLLIPASSTVHDRPFVIDALNAQAGLQGKSVDLYTNISQMYATQLKNKASLPFDVCDADIQSVRRAMQVGKCEDRSSASSANSWGFAVVFGAIALVGVGHSMPWTLGMPLIDDNVSRKNTPFFFAGVFFIRIMGPVLGFVIGGWANKLYVTLKPPHGLSPSDPGWIGAWWLGFLIVSCTLFVPSLMLFCFPEIHLKNSKFAKKRSDVAGNSNAIEAEATTLTSPSIKNETGILQNLKIEVKDFGLSVAECLKSPVYTGSLLGRLFDAFAFKGFFVFQPKYLEHHYGLPQYQASFYMAIIGIVGFAAGVLLGSVIMRKLKLDGRKAAAYIGFASLTSSILAFTLIFVRCDSVNSQISMKVSSSNYTFDSSCSKSCNCSGQSLFPVCDPSGKIYFSPCNAGCKKVEKSPLKMSFNLTQCSCSDNQQVSKEFCTDDCKTSLNIYVAISIISGIISGSSVIPGMIMLFRSVPHDFRSVALGFSTFLVSMLSTFPSPIVFGSIIDTTCVLWEKVCGSKGACQLYDSTLIRTRIHVFQAILRFAGSIFDVWVWYFAKGMKLMEDLDLKKRKNSTDENGNQEEENATHSQHPEGVLVLNSPIRKNESEVSLTLNMLNQFGSMFEIQGEPPASGERKLSLML